ncbi:MAG: DUF4124 domain-containing protein [Xanthomonadales bacterium]|nr:hypothetical protein [Xanthomonadales bacterium]MCC6592017.1 DUF4124 domain-containing protein [Xanthomonadales bacterium]MCE7931407.1 DUF4124 domain-containing protein [Xanthomonadales bacterium PRO6]
MRVGTVATLLLLLAAAALAWWYFWPQALPAGWREVLPVAESSEAHNPTLYKWKDARGRWQVSDQPPPAGVPYEKVRIHPDTNVLPAGVPPEQD